MIYIEYIIIEYIEYIIIKYIEYTNILSLFF